jgi:RHS repeat-associated protein
MKKILLFILFSNTLLAQVAPTANLPWIKVQTARIATTNPSDLNEIEKGYTSVQYMDGSGRNLQTVNYKASPTQKDLILGANTLDNIGRPVNSYLPTASTGQNLQYQSGYAAVAQSFYNDTKPFSKVDIYDASPLNTALKTLGPGLAFQSASTIGMSQDFETAGAGIRKYVIANSSTIDGSQNYQNGDLIKSVSIDEDGNEVTEYRGGKSGRLLQVHQKSKNSAETLITAYVYDFMGRLRYVIPPKLYNYASTFFVSGITFEGIYRFEYDSRGRLIDSFKPGGGSTFTIYNELGQTVMSQNARQRETNLWVWMKYDGHGRKVLSGTLITTTNQATLQEYFDNYNELEQFEERATSSQLLGYTTRSFPSQITITENDIKAAYYYDNYTWTSNAALGFQEYKTPKWNNATGLATGSRVRNLANNTWLTSVQYYDDKNRFIQSQTENRFGSVNQSDVVMNFVGEVLEERTIYRKPGQEELIVGDHYTYDHIGRKTGAYQKVNGKATPIAQYKYDEIGRLIQKNLMQAGQDSVIESTAQPNGDVDLANKYILLQPGTISAANGTYLACVTSNKLQEIDFSYNIRGQLRGINLDNSGNISLTNGDVFGLKLDYFETAQTYNGKINKQAWQSSSSVGNRSFAYGYDGFDRLNTATYSGQGSENYSMPGVTYDLNGNITTLQRNGLTAPNTWGQTDNLDYQYFTPQLGNKLNGVKDFATTNIDFKDNGVYQDYTYYLDGSLKTDANKGITNIVYNYMGLEERIEFGPNQRIENSFDAEGMKLSQKLVSGSNAVVTDYMGGLIYKDDVLNSISHDEGFVKITNGLQRYQFIIADHLGNTRVIIERIDESTAIVQETHYGAWGEILKGIGAEGDWNFLFQGKEYVDAFGYNNHDFHSRSYDPYSGRFNQLDGANQFASGYIGLGNNPVSGVDPDGQWVNFAIGAVLGGFSGYQLGKSQGAKGWGMAGYIFGGAAIGAATVGIGNAVLGSFSAAATSGMTLGQSVLAYGTTGAVSGAFGGGAMAALGGQDVGRGILNGVLFGAAGGVLSGGLQHLGFLNELNKSPLLAKIDPPNGSTLNPIQLDELVVKGFRYGLNPAHSGAVQPNYFFEDLFTGGAIFKGLGVGLKYGAGFFGTWFGRNTAKYAVQFGKTENQIYHTFRHTDALGLERKLVQSTIEKHLNKISSEIVSGKPFNQIIEILGHKVQYTAFKLSEKTINIGRIHAIR